MFKPSAVLVMNLCMWPGAFLGYRFAGAKGAVIGFFVGAGICFLFTILAFPSLLNDEEMQRWQGIGVQELVKSSAVLFFVAAGIFVIFTPQSLRGGYLGYADPFTPLALGMGALFALVRLKQTHPYSEVRGGVIVFLRSLGVLWMLAIFSAFLWHSDPVARSVSRVQAGQYAEAIAILDQVIEKNPNKAMAYQNRGMARLCSGQAADAIEDYTQLIRLEPENPSGYLMQGIARKMNGEDPTGDFDRYLKLKPDGKASIEKTEVEVKQKVQKEKGK